MDISVIVPLYNEDESLPELSAWIARVMDAHRFTYEIVMVDDGSNDTSWQVIESLSTVVFKWPREMSLSRWTPICRTARTKFRLSTTW